VDISSARVIQDGDKEIAFAFLPHFQSTGGRIAPDLKVRHRSGCQALATVRRMSLEHCQSYLLMRPVVCRPCHSADLTHWSDHVMEDQSQWLDQTPDAGFSPPAGLVARPCDSRRGDKG
jgi:hypothetical protein